MVRLRGSIRWVSGQGPFRLNESRFRPRRRQDPSGRGNSLFALARRLYREQTAHWRVEGLKSEGVVTFPGGNQTPRNSVRASSELHSPFRSKAFSGAAIFAKLGTNRL
jgi:hypothetical protein